MAIRLLLSTSDTILRGPRWDQPTWPGIRPAVLIGCTVLWGALYGAVMGSFGGVAGDRALQLLISATKVPILLLVTFLISFPSFLILNKLFGLQPDFGYVIRALISSQAGLTVVLASLAPYTAFWYCSYADYRTATLFNGMMFAIASLSAQVLLLRHYRPLIAREPKHRLMLVIWLIIYTFVGIQMAWILRPFLGDPTLPVQFFRESSWGNAYVVLGRLIWSVLTR